MATHSSILACRIPWTEEPGGLKYMGSQRVRHGWVTNPQGHWLSPDFSISRSLDYKEDEEEHKLSFLINTELQISPFPQNKHSDWCEKKDHPRTVALNDQEPVLVWTCLRFSFSWTFTEARIFSAIQDLHNHQTSISSFLVVNRQRPDHKWVTQGHRDCS